ncbi:NUDIX domain-containing protein [Streptomyces albidoflavus]
MYMSSPRRENRPTPFHSVSVAGVAIRDDGRILTIQRADNGTWEPPGGVLDLAESPKDGVRREVYEETGIRVTDALLDRAPRVRAHDGRRLAGGA